MVTGTFTECQGLRTHRFQMASPASPHRPPPKVALHQGHLRHHLLFLSNIIINMCGSQAFRWAVAHSLGAHSPYSYAPDMGTQGALDCPRGYNLLNGANRDFHCLPPLERDVQGRKGALLPLCATPAFHFPTRSAQPCHATCADISGPATLMRRDGSGRPLNVRANVRQLSEEHDFSLEGKSKCKLSSCGQKERPLFA